VVGAPGRPSEGRRRRLGSRWSRSVVGSDPMTERATAADPGTATVPTETGAASTEVQANRAFTTSMLVSGIRCNVPYLVLTIVAPLVGIATSVGPVLGLVIGAVALVSNAVSIRRFWRARHRWRVPVTWAHAAVIVLITFLMVGDVRALLS